MRGVSEVRILGLLHIAIMSLYERKDGHQKQFASKVLVGLTHLKGPSVAFDLGRGGQVRRWVRLIATTAYISIPHYIDACSGRDAHEVNT